MSDVDRARQLNLFPDLHCTTEPPPPPLADPQPSAERRTKDDDGGALIHATADTDTRPGLSFAGALHAQGELLWRCQHVHRSADGALVCAWRERRARLDRAGAKKRVRRSADSETHAAATSR
jgi:hypothetical protein